MKNLGGCQRRLVVAMGVHLLIKQTMPSGRRRWFKCDAYQRCVTCRVCEFILLEKGFGWGCCGSVLSWLHTWTVWHSWKVTFADWQEGSALAAKQTDKWGWVLFTPKENCAQNLFVRGTLVNIIAEGCREGRGDGSHWWSLVKGCQDGCQTAVCAVLHACLQREGM